MIVGCLSLAIHFFSWQNLCYAIGSMEMSQFFLQSRLIITIVEGVWIVRSPGNVRRKRELVEV